jgi:hypothetical protein
MAKMNRLDRRGSGPFWFVALILLVYALYSLAIAGATADKCSEGQGREWQIAPPEWVCTTPRIGG